jgi:hypothetical protein
MTTFTPLKQVLQQTITLGTELDWQDISQQNQALISAAEFVSASSSYPIFLTKNSHNGSFSAIALLGLQQDNVFFKGQASHNIAYLPKSLSMLPFGLGPDPENEQQLITCINVNSELVNQSGAAPLLSIESSSGERLRQINQELSAIFQEYVSTEHFIAALLEHQLLQELALNVNGDNGETTTIKGLYSINEQRLKQLTTEQKLLFIERGYYPPILAMLASLVQVNRMIKLYEKTPGVTVQSVNIKVI